MSKYIKSVILPNLDNDQVLSICEFILNVDWVDIFYKRSYAQCCADDCMGDILDITSKKLQEAYGIKVDWSTYDEEDK